MPGDIGFSSHVYQIAAKHVDLAMHAALSRHKRRHNLLTYSFVQDLAIAKRSSNPVMNRHNGMILSSGITEVDH